MKKGLLLICLVTIGLLFLRKGPLTPQEVSTHLPQLIPKQKETIPEPHTGFLAVSLFIPYWNIPASDPHIPDIPKSQLATLIYFGVVPDKSGHIRTDEPGYTGLSRFSPFEHTSLLTIRMMDEPLTREILENTNKQKTLINEAAKLATTYAFEGILLDLEHSVLPTQKTTDLVTDFVQNFSQQMHSKNMSFTIALYGDSYYRPRPYDVAKIAPLVDHMYIMAYDFHKSYGEPGPNFPLHNSSEGKQLYAYSLEDMLADFTQDIQPSKITVLFGAYGYDWSVDDQNRPAKAATARPFTQISARFYPCSYPECTLTTDAASSETHIKYTDTTGQRHSLWTETIDSLTSKTDFLRTKGISQIGYWAYGYY